MLEWGGVGSLPRMAGGENKKGNRKMIVIPVPRRYRVMMDRGPQKRLCKYCMTEKPINLFDDSVQDQGSLFDPAGSGICIDCSRDGVNHSVNPMHVVHVVDGIWRNSNR